MDFDLTVPCKSCPFRKSKGAVRGLGKGRALEIGRMMLSSQGGTFTCHSNAHKLGLPKDKPEKHCAGALIFAEKHKNATQIMRCMERIGVYDPAALMAESNREAVDDVFDSLADFTKAQGRNIGTLRAEKSV